MNTTIVRVIADLASANAGSLGTFVPRVKEFAEQQADDVSVTWLLLEGQRQEFEHIPGFGFSKATEQIKSCRDLDEVTNRLTELLRDLMKQEQGRPSKPEISVITFNPTVYRLAEQWKANTALNVVPRRMADFRGNTRPVDDRPSWDLQVSLDEAANTLAVVMQKARDEADKNKWRTSDVVTYLRPHLPKLHNVNTQGMAQNVIEHGVARGLFDVNQTEDNNWEFWLAKPFDSLSDVTALPTPEPRKPVSGAQVEQPTQRRQPKREWERNLKNLGISLGAKERELCFEILEEALDGGHTVRKFRHSIAAKHHLLGFLASSPNHVVYFHRRPQLCERIAQQIPVSLGLDVNREQELERRLKSLAHLVCQNFVRLLFHSGSVVDCDSQEVRWSDYYNPKGYLKPNKQHPQISGVRKDYQMRCVAFITATIISFDKLSSYDDFYAELAGIVFNDKSADNREEARQLVVKCVELGWVKEENGKLFTPNHPLKLEIEQKPLVELVGS